MHWHWSAVSLTTIASHQWSLGTAFTCIGFRIERLFFYHLWLELIKGHHIYLFWFCHSLFWDNYCFCLFFSLQTESFIHFAGVKEEQVHCRCVINTTFIRFFFSHNSQYSSRFTGVWFHFYSHCWFGLDERDLSRVCDSIWAQHARTWFGLQTGTSLCPFVHIHSASLKSSPPLNFVTFQSQTNAK